MDYKEIPIYCGNNANHRPLIEGKVRLGTRYECLLKGKSFGLSLPIDFDFKREYIPIVPLKKYCGNKIILPSGYDRFGTLNECRLTGIGVGKREKAIRYIENKEEKEVELFSFPKNSRKNPIKKSRKGVRKSIKKSRKGVRKSIKKSRKGVRKSIKKSRKRMNRSRKNTK